ncbi:MAG: winged helix-turn-helix domain-containing protein [Acidobacteriia bacterium]|nr:winged helix-turn-helix domain-containing protein [Terriglobia bacterium]
MPSIQQSGVISFGSFQLDPDTGSLEKHGVRVRLPRQPARILTFLAQRAGTVITREELRELVWASDTFVDFEHGLNAAINKLRQALGDSADKPRFIETLPGQGYRFVAAVRIEPPKQTTQEASTPEPVRAPSPIQAPVPAPRGLSWPVLLAFGGLAAGLLVAATWVIARRDPSPVRPLRTKFIIPAPEGFAFQPAGARQAFAISPDGSRLAFTAIADDGQFRLWIRDLASLEPREVPAARGAYTVFWSPGGDALYFSVDRSLRRVTADAGSSYQIISDLPRRVPPLGAWIAPDRILLSYRQLTVVVPAAGGRATTVEDAYLWPQALPDGKHLLYLAYDKRIERFRLRVGRFGDPQGAKDILETDSRVSWVASSETPGSGYLIYVRAGSLLAQPFDAEGLRLTGDAVPLAGNMHVFQPTAAADFSVSNNGVLVYQPLRNSSRMVWLDRSGREIEQVGPDNLSVVYVRASPDGHKIAAAVHNPEKGASEIWVYDTQSKVNRVLVPGPGIADKPVWSHDGTRLLYSRALGSGPKLYVRGLAEQDREEPLPSTDFQLPIDWSRDGRFVLFQTDIITDGDVGVVDLKTRKLTWILHSPAHETSPVFSPDGRRVVFVSNDSGRLEAYAQAFEGGETPRLTGERLRISTEGAQLVRWRGDGREICYLGTDGVVYSVPIAASPQFRAGAPVALFRVPVASRAVLSTGFGFDVSADGSRFLLPTVREPLTSNLVVMQGWESFLKRK